MLHSVWITHPKEGTMQLDSTERPEVELTVFIYYFRQMDIVSRKVDVIYLSTTLAGTIFFGIGMFLALSVFDDHSVLWFVVSWGGMVGIFYLGRAEARKLWAALPTSSQIDMRLRQIVATEVSESEKQLFLRLTRAINGKSQERPRKLLREEVTQSPKLMSLLFVADLVLDKRFK